MAGKPKAPFYIAVGVVVLGLIGFAIYRSDLFAPRAGDGGGNGDGGNGTTVAGGGPDGQPGDPGAGTGGDPIKPQTVQMEADTAGITTVDEYEIKPQEALVPVSGVSSYESLEGNQTVRFALNVWAGWAPIIYANGGSAAKKIWKTPDGKEFKVELVLIDDPTTMLDSYATGRVHIGWATVDMLPLFMERLMKADGSPIDSRAMPRVVQQVDWSNGGDGIVVREEIKQIRDLRGKKIVLAQNSPSHYFALNMLVAAGVQPSEVEFVFTGDAFQAARLFATKRDVAACVSWAPDIYNLEKIQGNKLLVSTGTANRLIADVWFARADFARDNPGIVEGLIRGIFDGVEALKQEAARKDCAKLMSEFYTIPSEETLEMFADAYGTGWGDNYQFFVNKNYLANFERVWNNSYYLYKRIGVIKKPKVGFEKVVDFSYIKKLGEEDKYKKQQVKIAHFDFRKVGDQELAEKSFLTTTHYLHFAPNSSQLRLKVIRKDAEGNEVEEDYDPNVDFVLEKIGERIGQFELSRIVIEGHTDSSMKGEVDRELVLELSQKRAQAVLDELLKKFDTLNPNRFQASGRAWDVPSDPAQPGNHAKNRRVEVRILPAEGAE